MRPHLDVHNRSARVLIVDDERQNRQVLEMMLAREGYSIVTAANGEEALAAVVRDRPDLILLDVMMPGMDGYTVARRVKAELATQNIPIIMVTSLDDRQARMLGLNAGAEDFLSKPVDRAELCVRVRNLLRLKAFGDYYDRYSVMLEGEMDSQAAHLVDSERLYRETFDAAPVGIAHMDRDGRWLRVNQRLCDLLGYSRDVLLGPGAPDLLQSQAGADEEGLRRRLAAGEIDRGVVDERAYLRSDGVIVWVRVNLSVHRDAVGRFQHFVSVIEDITERRSLEARVRQASKMDAIGRLASGVAHDFNNLLSVILGYSEMLAEDLQPNDPMRTDLSEIQEAALRGVDLSRQLLAFSREQLLEPKCVNLDDVVGGMRTILGRLLGDDVEVEAIGTPALPGVMVDPGQMEQVIMNLAVNARDAMPKGGRLTIETAGVVLDDAYAAGHVGVTPGPHVMLAVTDTGVGIDKATQARMFEPFFTTKEVGKGTGLGLATVFGIVRQSGGSITVDSEVAVGTKFRVYFPSTGSTPVPAPERAVPDAVPGGSETILLVEDEDAVRGVARSILRRLGYDVLEARSGGDAILLCERYKAVIHLLLTDVVMPRMNGWELAARLAVRRPEMRVLYMSGHIDDAIVREHVDPSSAAFLQKPLTPEALGRKVREALGTAVLA